MSQECRNIEVSSRRSLLPVVIEYKSEKYYFNIQIHEAKLYQEILPGQLKAKLVTTITTKEM